MRATHVSPNPTLNARLTLAEARVDIKRGKVDFFGPGDGKRMVDASPCGTGKTTITLESLAELATGPVDIIVETTDRQKEIAEAYPNMRAELPRSAGDPDYRIPDELLTDEELAGLEKYQKAGFGGPLCPKNEACAASAEEGHSAVKTQCLPCPLKKYCGTMRQARELEEHRERGGHIVRTYPRLTGGGLEMAPTIVIDETPMNKLLEAVSFSAGDFTHENLSRYLDTEPASFLATNFQHVFENDGDVAGIPYPALINRLISTIEKRKDRLAEQAQERRHMPVADQKEHLAKSGGRFLTDLLIPLNQLRQCIKHGCRLRTYEEKDGQITVWNVAKTNIKKKTNVLVLDASFQPNVLGMILDPSKDFEKTGGGGGGLNLEVVHIIRNTSNEHLTKAAKAKANRARVLRDVLPHVDGKALLVGCLPVVEAFQKDGLPGACVGRHFAGLRGSNAYQDCQTAVIVGYALPAVSSFEARWGAMMLAAGMAGGIVRHERKGGEGYLPIDEDGLYYHPDPGVWALIKSKAHDDIVQAAGRLRSVLKGKPGKVVLVGQFLPDELKPFITKTLDRRDDTAADEYVRDQLERFGAVDLSPTAAFKTRPDLFNSVEMARRQLSTYRISTNSYLHERRVWGNTDDPRKLAVFQTISHGRTGKGAILHIVGKTDDEIEAVVGPFKRVDALAKTVTTITHERATATKTFRQTAGGNFRQQSSYGRGKMFHARTHELRGLRHFAEALPSADSKTFLVTGTPIEGDGHTRRTKKQFADVPKHLHGIDVDTFLLPMGIGVLDDPAYAVEILRRAMPEPFKSASFVAQLSASCGLKDPGVLKVHLWFWLAIPLTCRQMKAALGSLGEKLKGNKFRLGDVEIDGAPYNPVQPLYVADPIFENCDDPIQQRIFLVEGKTDELCLPLVEAVEDEPAEPIKVDDRAIAAAPESFKAALAGIGGDGFNEPILKVCRPAAIGIRSGKVSREKAVSIIQARVLSADPGGRSAEDIARYSSPEFINDKISWWLSHLGEAS